MLNREEKRDYTVSDEYFKHHIEGMLQRYLGSNDIAKVLHVSPIDEEMIQGDIKNHRLIRLMPLFFLAIGQDVYTYREIIFDTLEKMGAQGEQWWRGLMEHLCQFENKGLTGEEIIQRRKLYPQTLDEGRIYLSPS